MAVTADDRAPTLTPKELDQLIDLAEMKLAQMDHVQKGDVGAFNSLTSGLAKLKVLRGERVRRRNRCLRPFGRLRPAFSYPA